MINQNTKDLTILELKELTKDELIKRLLASRRLEKELMGLVNSYSTMIENAIYGQEEL